MSDEELDRIVSQSTYRNAELHRLDLADGEADLLEGIMTSANEKARAGEQPRSKRLRKPLAIAGIATAIIIGGSAVAASTLLDRDTNKMISGAPCSLDSGDARLVASGVDGQNYTVEYWVVRSKGGEGDFVALKNAEGRWVGGSAGCGSYDKEFQPRTTPFAVAQWDADGKQTYLHLYGWAPGAATVVVTLGDGSKVNAVPGKDGYFLSLATLTADARDRIGGVVRNMDLLDATGAVMQHVDF